MADWDLDQVMRWLNHLDLGQYCNVFKMHDIHGKELLELSHQDIKVCFYFTDLTRFGDQPFVSCDTVSDEKVLRVTRAGHWPWKGLKPAQT